MGLWVGENAEGEGELTWITSSDIIIEHYLFSFKSFESFEKSLRVRG